MRNDVTSLLSSAREDIDDDRGYRPRRHHERHEKYTSRTLGENTRKRTTEINVDKYMTTGSISPRRVIQSDGSLITDSVAVLNRWVKYCIDLSLLQNVPIPKANDKIKRQDNLLEFRN
ncbi:hypothetical protein DPMN_133264 [Dreissena polymorpha]|uniref:Uncharacterized protein n=1 Tax=Dreissena polymorpha TaxID=45954 RepID=A0A9D4FUW5_DREPO|nr:hypothetical protein DPMN_133264 [Dreissena polymorpha]